LGTPGAPGGSRAETRKRKDRRENIDRQCDSCRHAVFSTLQRPAWGTAGWRSTRIPASRQPRISTRSCLHDGIPSGAQRRSMPSPVLTVGPASFLFRSRHWSSCNEGCQPPPVIVITRQPQALPPSPPAPEPARPAKYTRPAPANDGASAFSLVSQGCSVRFAIAVWVYHGIPHYTAQDGTAGRTPPDSIDREAARRLNAAGTCGCRMARCHNEGRRHYCGSHPVSTPRRIPYVPVLELKLYYVALYY
jgi:hypothetical protein